MLPPLQLVALFLYVFGVNFMIDRMLFGSERHDSVSATASVNEPSFNRQWVQGSDGELRMQYVTTILFTNIILAVFVMYTILKDYLAVFFLDLLAYFRIIPDNRNREEVSALVEFRRIDELHREAFDWPHRPGFLPPGERSGYIDDIPFNFQRNNELFNNPFGNRPWPNGVHIISVTRIAEDMSHEIVNFDEPYEDTDADVQIFISIDFILDLDFSGE